MVVICEKFTIMSLLEHIRKNRLPPHLRDTSVDDGPSTSRNSDGSKQVTHCSNGHTNGKFTFEEIAEYVRRHELIFEKLKENVKDIPVGDLDQTPKGIVGKLKALANNKKVESSETDEVEDDDVEDDVDVNGNRSRTPTPPSSPTSQCDVSSLEDSDADVQRDDVTRPFYGVINNAIDNDLEVLAMQTLMKFTFISRYLIKKARSS